MFLILFELSLVSAFDLFHDFFLHFSMFFKLFTGVIVSFPIPLGFSFALGHGLYSGFELFSDVLINIVVVFAECFEGV